MKEQLQKDFDNIIKNLSLSQRDIEIKKFYLDNFINRGFPNRREEDWKFSDLNQIIKKKSSELLQKDLGIIFQDHYLISELNIFDNIKLKCNYKLYL